MWALTYVSCLFPHCARCFALPTTDTNMQLFYCLNAVAKLAL